MENHQRAMRALKRKHPYFCLFINVFVFCIGLSLSFSVGLSPIVLMAFAHWAWIFGLFLSAPLAFVIGQYLFDLIVLW